MKTLFPKITAVWAGLLACGLLVSVAYSQSVVINPITQYYWVGINTANVLGVGSNLVTTTGGPTVNLSLTGPSGVTPTLTPTVASTASTNLGVVLACTNVAAGANLLTISGSGGASYSTNAMLFVVPQWSATNSGSIGNWSSSANWSGGAVPTSTDSVYFERMAPASWTNVVDGNTSIQALILAGDADDNTALATGLQTLINPGVTLSVLGTNGFAIVNKASNSTRPQYVFGGGGSLLVSNLVANFIMNNGCSGSSTRITTVNMTNLNVLYAKVNRFGVADATLSAQGLIGGAMVTCSLPKTNTIITAWSDNYAGLDFQNAFNFGNNGEQASGSASIFLNLGLTNGIYADSVGVGRSHYQGSSGVGATMRFLPAFSNSAAPTASVYIRGTNGLRMPFLAVGVDSGSANSTKNTIGLVDLRGGKVDVLVDNVWLGANRTNTAAPTDTGGLSFDNGTVDANNVSAGYMQYTNGAIVKGTILVGTNGTLVVNTNLELGHTPSDIIGFPNSISAASGQVTINNGGTIRASKVTVGQWSTNNVITVNAGGTLVISNTLADANKSLTTLSLDGATLGFSVIAGVTNAYVTNLNTTATSSKINILSAPAGQSTNVLMVYQAANQVPNIVIGSLPPGFNNMQIVVDNVAKTVSVVVSTNQPKNLAWRGGANSQWDHSSLNWLDLNSSQVTKFTDGDTVTFDDTTGVKTNITITENVNPGQIGTGILVSNRVNQFTFNNSGVGVIGSCALVKQGTNSFELDCSTTANAQLNEGSIAVGFSGSLATASTAAGTILTIGGSASVAGAVTVGGTIQNAGTISGSLSLLASADGANSGTVSGTVSMQASCSLNNSGNLNGVGSLTVMTNSTLVNAGTIYGSTLTVNVGGALVDLTAGSAGVSSGSINVGSLNVFGSFYPGGTGNAITTTKVTDYDYTSSGQLGAPNGRIQLNSGSVTVIKVNLTNSQPYTKILSQSTVLGPSQGFKAFNGATLIISNIGPTAFSAGQSFKVFGQYYTDGNIGTAGFNTTNDFPTVIPNTPGPGLVWSFSDLYFQGAIKVLSANDPSLKFTLTNNMNTLNDSGTNKIVTQLTWPVDKQGGWVQQLTTSLTNGLSATNWVSLTGNYANTNIGYQIMSDTNVWVITNTVIASNAVFYRFVYP
jgi:hypothetical protein